MAAGFSDFLTDNEKAVLKGRPLVERAVALANVAELGLLLRDLEGTIEVVRASKDREAATRLGNLALQVSRQLRELGVTELTTEREEVPEAPAPADDTSADKTPVEVETAIEVSDEPIAVEITPDAEAPENEASAVPGLSPRVEAWFVASAGEDWLARLGLPLTASLEDVADKLVSLSEIRRPNTHERCMRRVLGHLRGESVKTIAAQGDAGSVADIHQYIGRIRSYFKAHAAAQAEASAEVTPAVEAAVDSASTEGGEQVAPGVSLRIEKWFVTNIGEDWRAWLSLPPTASVEEIADKLVALSGIRPPNTYEQSMLRMVNYLRGLSESEISALSGGSPAAVSQYTVRIRSLFKAYVAASAESSAEPAVTTGDSVPEVSFSDPRPASSVPEPAGVQPAVQSPPTAAERSLDEEPLHVQLAHRIKEALRLQGPEIIGLQAFLDPKSRGDMTKAKLEAIDKVRRAIRNKIDDPTFDLSAAEKQWVRRSFGVYTFSGTPQDRDPVTLFELTRGLRHPEQKDDVPDFIYTALEKLFVADTRQGRSVDSLIQAAVDPASLSESEFEQRRDELFAAVAETGELSGEQLAAVKARSRFGKKDEHRDVNDAVKMALRRFEQRIVKQGGVNSGDPLIDKIFKKFSSSNYIANHLDALRAELPAALQDDPSIIERIITAGIRSIYQHKAEEAA